MCATIVACLCSAMLEFPPGVTRLLVQVGAFLEPALPPPDAPHVASVIVEPVGATRRALVDKCAEEEARRNASFCAARVVLLGAAISNASGVGTMHLYNWGGVASSLSTVTAAVAPSMQVCRAATSSGRGWVRRWLMDFFFLKLTTAQMRQASFSRMPSGRQRVR